MERICDWSAAVQNSWALHSSAVYCQACVSGFIPALCEGPPQIPSWDFLRRTVHKERSDIFATLLNENLVHPLILIDF